MSIERLTKEDIRKTSGILNPIGHVVLAFKDDAIAAEAVRITESATRLGALCAVRYHGLVNEDLI